MVLGEASDRAPQQKWRWVKIHNVSLVRYMGKSVGSLCVLLEELEAENNGVSIPAEIRWLSRAKAQARFQELKDGTSSVVSSVLGDTTFNHICKSCVRPFERRYKVEASVEDRPDAFCNQCSRWGPIAPHYSAAIPLTMHFPRQIFCVMYPFSFPPLQRIGFNSSQSCHCDGHTIVSFLPGIQQPHCTPLARPYSSQDPLPPQRPLSERGPPQDSLCTLHYSGSHLSYTGQGGQAIALTCTPQ